MAVTKNPSVLIIDDNDVSRAMLRFIIASEHYEIVGEAASGTAGLELVEKLQPKIICLDVMLPDSSGLDILKNIKSQHPQSIVLMVTGNNDRETVLTAIRNGADGFIVKPFNPATLLNTIAQALVKTSKGD